MQYYGKYQYVVSFRAPFLHSWAKILCGVAKSGGYCHALAFSDPSLALLCTSESALPGFVMIKDEQAVGAGEPMEWDAGNRPDGSCAKRIALRSPMQRAARTSTARCDGQRTALRQQPNCTTRAGSTLFTKEKQYCGLPAQAYRHGLANRLGNGNQQYCFCLSVCLFWQGNVLPYRLQFNTCCRIACPSSG